MAVDDKKQRAFLAALSKCGSITRASSMASVSRRSHVNWLKDPSYAEQFKAARRTAADLLEIEARRRAVHGLTKPVLWRGQVCFAWVDKKGNYVPASDDDAFRQVPVLQHIYSDRLLMALLIAARPKKFGRRVVEHKGGVGVRFESREAKLRRVLEEINKMRRTGELPPRSSGPPST